MPPESSPLRVHVFCRGIRRGIRCRSIRCRGRSETGLFRSCPLVCAVRFPVLRRGRSETGLFLSRRNGSIPQPRRGVQPRLPGQPPIPKENDPMHVIRHHHKRVQVDVRVMRRQLVPRFVDQPPRRVQLHPAVRDTTKQMRPPVRTDRHRIRTCLRVVVSLKALRPCNTSSSRSIVANPCPLLPPLMRSCPSQGPV